MPLTFTTSYGPTAAAKVLAATAGTRAATIAADGTATFGYEFPGNIDGLVRRLSAVGVKIGSTALVSIPVKNLSGRTIDPTHFIADLNASPAVSGAAYDGATVSATVVCATNGFRYLYEEIIGNGLMPLDVPTAAHPLEFVL
jgi:hypothetical protein